MFERLGKFVERHWVAILCCWGFALLAAGGVHLGWFDGERIPLKIPRWKEVAKDGEFAFLPEGEQSLVAEELLAKAFPEDLLKSSVVIVVRRSQEPILPEDEQFIEEVLRPRLTAIRDELLDPSLEIQTFKSVATGKLLVSQDRKASLVILPLKDEFLKWSNKKVIDRIEDLLKELPQETDPDQMVPLGLDLAMSGSATVGRDMLMANNESAKSTELWTTILVVFLLIAIYRAPVVSLIPLATVFVSVQIALALVILLTQIPYWHYQIFFGMEVYITVVVYGTGVDYSLFLISRYREELDKGLSVRQALTATMANVGAAVTASALTVIFGIGMMVFAQFGKFREAGFGISLGLCVGLLAALTLTPALLRLAGRAAFWPYGRWERIQSRGGRVAGTTLLNRLVERNVFQRLWEHVGAWLVRKPGTILAACVLLMLPCAVWGIVNYEYLSYGLLSELPATKKSVIGAKAVQEHFPAGYAGPLTILMTNEKIDFKSTTGKSLLESAIKRLEEPDERKRLGIADVRYLKRPLGFNNAEKVSKLSEIVTRGAEKPRAADYYVTRVPELERHVTRADVVFETDPFDRQSIRQLNDVERALEQAIARTADEAENAIRASAAEAGDSSAELSQEDQLALAEVNDFRATLLHFVGPTASIRDLKTVTDKDQIKIDLLVLASVFAILLLLLRKPGISLYLILSVFFSYFVTLGVTFAVFQWLDGDHFGGLDWKAPMFLFTILMAIGADYNIFLMTRIEEEQRRHGLVEGVRVALIRTGTIISSCGVIMAGTFVSLMFGSLVGLKQLGFALAFGVLLDTFVVRPLLVPAYLVMLYQGRFGALSRVLGGVEPPSKPHRYSSPKLRVHADA
ncbi:MAG: MMPL family transporter [Planctomycetaceae bacterium]